MVDHLKRKKASKFSPWIPLLSVLFFVSLVGISVFLFLKNTTTPQKEYVKKAVELDRTSLSIALREYQDISRSQVNNIDNDSLLSLENEDNKNNVVDKIIRPKIKQTISNEPSDKPSDDNNNQQSIEKKTGAISYNFNKIFSKENSYNQEINKKSASKVFTIIGANERQKEIKIPVAKNDKLKIFILIGGYGLNNESLRLSFAKLPKEIALGFVPYSKNIYEKIDLAKKNGFSVFAELPMEHGGQALSSQNTFVLTQSASQQENLQKLLNIFKPFGNIGFITNYLGNKFMGSGKSFLPIAKYLIENKIRFIDDTGFAKKYFSLNKDNYFAVDIFIDPTKGSKEVLLNEINKALSKVKPKARGSIIIKTYARAEMIDAISLFVNDLPADYKLATLSELK